MGHFPLFIHFKTIILYSVNPYPDTGTCFIQNIYAPSSCRPSYQTDIYRLFPPYWIMEIDSYFPLRIHNKFINKLTQTY